MEFTGFAYEMEIKYDCPECGTRLMVKGHASNETEKANTKQKI
jgi:DNA-directed RNA polymerase subunit RPC12/RpoP